MNIFPEMVTVINRAPVPITVRFDGEEKMLQPGENIVPRVVVPYAKSQNPVMGSEDFFDPTGYKFLVSVKGRKKDPQEMLTKEEWEDHLSQPQRLNRQQVIDERGDPRAREVLRGRKKQSAFEARFAVGNGDGAGLGSETPA